MILSLRQVYHLALSRLYLFGGIPICHHGHDSYTDNNDKCTSDTARICNTLSAGDYAQGLKAVDSYYAKLILQQKRNVAIRKAKADIQKAKSHLSWIQNKLKWIMGLFTSMSMAGLSSSVNKNIIDLINLYFPGLIEAGTLITTAMSLFFKAVSADIGLMQSQLSDFTKANIWTSAAVNTLMWNVAKWQAGIEGAVLIVGGIGSAFATASNPELAPITAPLLAASVTFVAISNIYADTTLEAINNAGVDLRSANL